MFYLQIVQASIINYTYTHWHTHTHAADQILQHFFFFVTFNYGGSILTCRQDRRHIFYNLKERLNRQQTGKVGLKRRTVGNTYQGGVGVGVGHGAKRERRQKQETDKREDKENFAEDEEERPKETELLKVKQRRHTSYFGNDFYLTEATQTFFSFSR